MKAAGFAIVLAACGGNSAATPDSGDDAPVVDATPDSPAGSGGLGVVSNPHPVTCPAGAAAGATCTQVTVSGCPGIETESIDAVVAVVMPTVAVTGTVTHFSGSGGRGFQNGGVVEYARAGFRNAQVAWLADWEQTASAGILAGGCRPATILKWIFDEPTLHAGSRSLAFCGEGFSGGSGQLGYALAHYGMADYLDYVNELSGPPFARIDLGCNGDAPRTAMVCGAAVTMRLPQSLDMWENIAAPLTCGSTGVPAAELARWQADSIISTGAVYAYPKTQVEFFDCTNSATAVTGMAQLFYNELMGGTTTSYHCYDATNNCMNEGLGTGNQDAIAAMLAGCVPRHQ
jgi:hypothetical protein